MPDTISADTKLPADVLGAPGATVAAALTGTAPDINGLVASPELRSSVFDALEAATGKRAFPRSLRRDWRPFGEFLAVAEMIDAQRRVVRVAQVA